MTGSPPEFARVRRALAKSAIFGPLPAHTLDVLAHSASLQRFEKGGRLDAAASQDKLWFVLEGGLVLYWVNVRGDTTPVAPIGIGSFYNTASLVEGGKPSWECRIERGTVVAVIPGPVIRERAAMEQDFAHCLSRILLQRYQATLSAYADAVAESLPVRVARRLLGQALAAGAHDPGTEITLSISQGDLAQTLGVSRSKLNAELRSLQAGRAIRLGYRKIYVCDLPALEKVSGGPVFVL